MTFAKKSLGQNFLTDVKILNKIVNAADITPEDTVIEVGPGKGSMTDILSQRASRVIAVEKDFRLIPFLKERFSDSNVKIIESDILKINPREFLKEERYKIVANIPYYITSHFIRLALEQWPQPEIIVLVVQKEVAERIMAKPPNMNLLALSVQMYADAKKIDMIKKGSFQPSPKVDSAIIRLKPGEKINSDDAKKIFNLMRLGFGEKRKQLASILTKKLEIRKEEIVDIFKRAGISPNARSENLGLDDWARLKQML